MPLLKIELLEFQLSIKVETPIVEALQICKPKRVLVFGRKFKKKIKIEERRGARLTKSPIVSRRTDTVDYSRTHHILP